MGHEFEELSGRILEAAVAVHKALGPGFLESIYQKGMEVALRHRGLTFQQQKEIHIFFEDEDVGVHKLDMIVGGEIIGRSSPGAWSFSSKSGLRKHERRNTKRALWLFLVLSSFVLS